MGYGGAEKLLEETLPMINNDPEFEVHLLQLTDDDVNFDKNLKTHRVPIDVIQLRKPNSFRNIYYIKKYIEEGKFDLVHVHLFPSQYWTALAVMLMVENKPRLVTTEHNTHNRRRQIPLFRPLDRFIYSKFDSVISIGEKTQEALLNWLKVNNKNEKFKIIQNGVNVDRFRNAQPYAKSEIDQSLSIDSKILCMVARFEEQKDHATVVRAMKGLPKDVKLVLVGTGPLVENIKKLANELHIEDQIIYLGFRNDVDRILKSIDIAIVSSHWEGFGLVAVEAMSAGKPIIASDVDGLKEVVGQCGILFEKGNDDELRRAILSLINNTDYYKEMSVQASDRAKVFTLDTMVDKTKQLYRDLLSTRNMRN